MEYATQEPSLLGEVPEGFFFYVKYCYGLRSVIGVLFCVIRLLEYVDVRVINGFVFFPVMK